MHTCHWNRDTFMLIWIGFALLTAGVLALLRPFFAPGASEVKPAAADLAVYRDQLKEIATDQERGLIAGSEAQSARTEVARRLLERSADADKQKRSDRDVPRVNGAIVRNAIAGLVPLVSIAAYLVLGSPGLPSHPFVKPGSIPVEQASQAELVAMVEARLRDEPGDGKGWDVIAPVYFRQGRFAESAEAYARAIRILGETQGRLYGLAEATIIANNGLVTEDARKALERILELNPGNGEAGFGLALAKEQDGRTAEAIADYRRLLDNSPKDARWRPAAEAKLFRLEKKGAPAGNAPPVEGMSEAERAKFIVRMVDGLAARLKSNGKDLPGWLQLVRSYKVLGRDADANAALGEARRQFEGDAKSLGELDGLAKSIGLGS